MSPVIFLLAVMVGTTAWNDSSEWFSRGKRKAPLLRMALEKP
ncbi:MAG: hypothetical protein U0R19_39555 [Bryobacteraceae bacterium]